MINSLAMSQLVNMAAKHIIVTHRTGIYTIILLKISGIMPNVWTCLPQSTYACQILRNTGTAGPARYHRSATHFFNSTTSTLGLDLMTESSDMSDGANTTNDSAPATELTSNTSDGDCSPNFDNYRTSSGRTSSWDTLISTVYVTNLDQYPNYLVRTSYNIWQ